MCYDPFVGYGLNLLMSWVCYILKKTSLLHGDEVSYYGLLLGSFQWRETPRIYSHEREGGRGQDDQISPYLFLLAAEGLLIVLLKTP
jgi:hypothetical protein